MLSKLSTLLLSLAALCTVVAADFPLAAWDDDGAHRLWYGDGNLYVGSTIPADVEIAFNFTILEPRNSNFDMWFLTPSIADIDLPPSLHLGQRPFLAIKPLERTSPVFFTDDVAKFIVDGVGVAYTWMHYNSLAIPTEQDGDPIAGAAYLADTDTEGTWMLVWDQEKKAAAGAGTRMVSLLTTLGEDE